MLPPFFYLIVFILTQFAIFLIVTLSLNLEVGHTGIPEFGRVIAVIAGAFAVGAVPGRIFAYFLGLPFGADYASTTENYKIVSQINNLLANNVGLAILYLLSSIVFAAIIGGFVGWLTSRPAIRLKEAYLGISLLAFGDVFMWFGYNYQPLIGGSTAIAVPDPFAWYPGDRFLLASSVIIVFAIISFVITEMLTKSPFGRTLKMLRDDEVAAEVLGKNIVTVRTRSLVIGSAMAAVAGALYVMYVGRCNASAFSRLTWTFWPWAYMMLGGTGSNIGIVVGVLFFVIIRTLIVIYRYDLSSILPFDPIWLEYTLAGLAIILVVLFKPHGLIPEKTEPFLPKEEVKKLKNEALDESEVH
ncbi:MAG: branched-chain amino acid ABC transporter permease [Candidatus Asgardarchaeia archaeon]